MRFVLRQAHSIEPSSRWRARPAGCPERDPNPRPGGTRTPARPRCVRCVPDFPSGHEASDEHAFRHVPSRVGIGSPCGSKRGLFRRSAIASTACLEMMFRLVRLAVPIRGRSARFAGQPGFVKSVGAHHLQRHTNARPVRWWASPVAVASPRPRSWPRIFRRLAGAARQGSGKALDRGAPRPDSSQSSRCLSASSIWIRLVSGLSFGKRLMNMPRVNNLALAKLQGEFLSGKERPGSVWIHQPGWVASEGDTNGQRSAFILNAESHGHSVHDSDRMSVAHSRQDIGAPSVAAWDQILL
jgi:hypothetical protein